MCNYYSHLPLPQSFSTATLLAALCLELSKRKEEGEESSAYSLSFPLRFLTTRYSYPRYCTGCIELRVICKHLETQTTIILNHAIQRKQGKHSQHLFQYVQRNVSSNIHSFVNRDLQNLLAAWPVSLSIMEHHIYMYTYNVIMSVSIM